MFAVKPGNAQREYIRFVQDEESLEVTEFFNKKNLASVFGSKEFVQWVKGKYYELKKNGEVPQSHQLAPTIADIKKAVIQNYGIKDEVLTQSRRGHVNEPRNAAIYLSRKLSGMRLEEISKEFGYSNYSSVSSVVIRTDNYFLQNKQHRKRIDEIIKKLTRSQAKT